MASLPPIRRRNTNSRVPSLRRRYPPSSLLWTPPPPSRLRPLSREHRLYGLPCSGDFSPGRGRFLQLLDMPCVTVLSPSGAGELHPGALTEPDVSLSTYPARATPADLPACHHHLRAPPVAGWPCGAVWVTCPLRSPEITPASSLLQGSPSLVSASVLSASRDRRLGLFPWHRRPGSQVPHASPDESHAA